MNFVDLINNPIEKKLESLNKERKNLIGILFLTKKNLNKEKQIYNLLCEQTTLLDRLYLVFDKKEYPNEIKDFENTLSNIIKGLGNKIEVIFLDKKLKICKLLNYYKNEHIFLFKEMYYENDTIRNALSMINSRSVINLSNDKNHKRRIYDNSILTYKNIENSPLYQESINREPSYLNMVDSDILIPAGLSFDYTNGFNSNEYYDDLELFFTIQCFKNKYTIYLNDLNTVNNFNIEHELNLLKYLMKHNDLLKQWQSVYKGYNFNKLNIENSYISMSDICNSKVDIGIINFNFPEMTCQNVIQLEKNCIFPINKVLILSNCNKPDISLELYQYSYYLSHKKIWNKIEILNNEFDKEFKRKQPYRYEQEYGKDLYDQSIEYLKSKSDADYLIVFNDKIILENILVFNDNYDYEMGKYIKIICLKEKKEIKELESEQIILPVDYDRFASTIFRACNLRKELVEKHLRNYNKVFDYDNNRNS